MENTEIELDSIIEKLNKNRNIPVIVSNNFVGADLTDSEKNFIRTYSPEKSLIAYGSLAPDRSNHSVVEHIRGKWEQGIVRGKLERKGWGADVGYNAFRHTDTAEQEEIKAFVLFSDELIIHWQRLDDFEGDGYKRILAKYELDNGKIGVGFIYAINEE